ncbi:MAG: alkaline phosphatase family protein, partial [Acidobacteriota bacterium]
GTTLYLAYLVRGGRVAQAGEVAWQGWFVWSALLAMALGVGHVIGGLTRLGSIATMMVAAGAVGPPARRHRVRRRVAVVWTVVGLAGVTAALVFVPAGAGDRTPPAFRPRPSSGRIVVIGVDGLSSDLLDRMTALGVCPTIARLERTAARYAIAREPGLTPPRAWTTIATGRPASEHGVLGYSAGPIPGVSTLVQETRRSAGLSLGLLMPPLFRSRAPVDAGFRRAKALWEILPGGGVPTAAVNWWATWPAGRGPAVVMSQRAFIRFSAGAAPHEDVWPPSLQRSLSSSFQPDRREALSLLRGFLMGGDEGGLAQRAGLIDGYHARVAGRLLDQASLRVLLLYLPGIDILRSGQAGAASAPVTRLVAHLDALIEPFVRRMTDQDLLLLVGDPGRQEAGGAVAPGVLLVRSGRIAVAGRRSETISLLDLAPTVLALAGFPMAEDLPGRPVLDFLDEKARARLSAGKISTFGDRPSPAGEEAADPLDEEVLDRLRSLGYIR